MQHGCCLPIRHFLRPQGARIPHPLQGSDYRLIQGQTAAGLIGGWFARKAHFPERHPAITHWEFDYMIGSPVPAPGRQTGCQIDCRSVTGPAGGIVAAFMMQCQGDSAPALGKLHCMPSLQRGHQTG